MKKKVVVIGAGIAGLSFSIEMLLKGYEVTLIEKNNEVGGLCSGYYVNGHYIDACIHWLMGTKKDSQLYNYWKRIGAFSDNQKFISLPSLGTFEYQGSKVTFYRDIERTRQELLALSPEDERPINLFIDSVIETNHLMGLAQNYDGINAKEYRARIRNYPHIMRTTRMSREDYAKRFKHPAIQFAIKNCQTGYSNMFFFLDLYGIFIAGNADIPVGGALYMVERIKNKFLGLGGKLLLNTEAHEVVVEDDEAKYVRTSKGDLYGDYIVSCIDANYSLKTLLKGEYSVRVLEWMENKISKRPISSCFNVYIAVKGDLNGLDVPTGLNISPIKLGSHKSDFLLVRPYHFDKCFINNGKTVVSLFIDQNQDDYAYYKSLSKDEYKKEVEKTVKEMVSAFIKRYPEYKDKVEVLLYFTPIELNERTYSSYGAIQAYSFSKKGIFYMYSGKVRGLKNFYLCSQWNRAIGGTPTALLSAMNLAKKIK